MNRRAISGIAGRPVLDGRPSEIRTWRSFINFLGFAADVVDEHAASRRINRECKRVAAANRPDRAIFPRSLRLKWIIGGNRAVAIQAQNFSEQRLEGLCWLFR